MRSLYYLCLLFSLSTIIGSLPAKAQEWRFTDSLRYPRYSHTATKLMDGRVLVVGGSFHSRDPEWSAEKSNSYHPPCEIYDPRTETWSEAGYLLGPRWGHKATLLPDGRVLIAGGSGLGYDRNQICEIYDPATNAWDTTGPLNNWRCFASAISLRDGRVLIIGGHDASGKTHRQGELYDPSTRQWRLMSSIDTGYPSSLTLLKDGRVLALTVAIAFVPISKGAPHEMKAVYSTAWRIFDPETEAWSDPGWDGSVIGECGVALLGNNRVLVAGGYDLKGFPDRTPFSRKAMLFDPDKEKWSSSEPCLERRHRDPEGFSGSNYLYRSSYSTVKLVTLKDGNTLMLGGADTSLFRNRSDDRGNYVDTQIFDYRTGTWHYAGHLNEERIHCQTTLLDDGRVLLTGGTGRTEVLRSCEIFSTGSSGRRGNSNY